MRRWTLWKVHHRMYILSHRQDGTSCPFRSLLWLSERDLNTKHRRQQKSKCFGFLTSRLSSFRRTIEVSMLVKGWSNALSDVLDKYEKDCASAGVHNHIPPPGHCHRTKIARKDEGRNERWQRGDLELFSVNNGFVEKMQMVSVPITPFEFMLLGWVRWG